MDRIDYVLKATLQEGYVSENDVVQKEVLKDIRSSLSKVGMNLIQTLSRKDYFHTVSYTIPTLIFTLPQYVRSEN